MPKRITNKFILEALEIILRNKNFSFNLKIINQTLWTAKGTKYAPPSVCLTTGYKEEGSLFNMELHKCFNMEETELKETVDLVTFTEEILKGTLILIWKSRNMFLFICSCSYQ